MIDPVNSFQHRPLRTLSSVFQEALQTLFQTLLLLLLLLGIGGSVYKAIGAEGFLPGLLRAAWQIGPAYLLFVAVTLVVGALGLKRLLYRRPAAVTRAGDVLMFGCLALGTFCGLRLMITGGL